MKKKRKILLIAFASGLFLVWFFLFCSFLTDWKWMNFFVSWDNNNNNYIDNVETEDLLHHLTSYKMTSVEYSKRIPGLIYKDKDKDKEEHTSNIIRTQMQVSEPTYFTLLELFTIWPPNDTSANRWLESPAYPDKGHGIMRFRYDIPAELKQAELFRKQEIPFILTNVPDMLEAESAFELKKLLHHFGSTLRMVEKSQSNYFIYYSVRNLFRILWRYPSWHAPQLDVPMTFSTFLHHALDAEKAGSMAGDRPLHYFNINAGEGYSLPWIREAFHFFSPDKPSFFVVEPEEFRGINCRFGMRGVTAAAHYDSGRNFVAMVRGRKRYVLLPPRECDKLSLLPRSHPSGRHTSVDWTDTALLESKHPTILTAQATEAILSAGEVLYIPSFWFHFIVSQDASIQCNARSGDSQEGAAEILRCMEQADRQFAPFKSEPPHTTSTSTHHRQKQHMEHTWHFEE